MHLAAKMAEERSIIPFEQIIERHVQNPATVRSILQFARDAQNVWRFGQELRAIGQEGADTWNDVLQWMSQKRTSWGEFQQQVTDAFQFGETYANGYRARRQAEMESQSRNPTMNDLIDSANANDPFNVGQGQLNSGATPVRDVGTGGR